jgi:peptidyl-prolyl cis-trans isomerase C
MEVNTTMKKASLYALPFFLCLHLLCCSQESAEESQRLARINDYSLTLDEFKYQLAAEQDLDRDLSLTHEAKKELLDGLITKELLIQEAKKLKLDRKDKFIRAMERYWESTLIRDLMDLKLKEIEKKAYVSEADIDSEYKEMKESDETLPPLQEMRDRIMKEIKRKKSSRMLEEWIKDLRKKAKIEINQDLLLKD